jgi:hypothetical protein
MRKKLLGVPMFFWAVATVLVLWALALYKTAREDMWPDARETLTIWWRDHYG